MTADHTFYRDLAYVFGGAVVGGALAKWLRQPLILGYVLGGVIVGPFTPGLKVSDVHQFELLAEIGVMLLMYSIGLEFSFRELLRVKWVAVIGGPLGIVLSMGLGWVSGRLLGWPPGQGIAVGAVVSVASTMVLSRALMERGELLSLHGRVMIGITLVEDLAVVILTVLLSSLGEMSHGLSSIGLALAKALLVLVPVGFVAMKLVPLLMRYMNRVRSDELHLLVILALGFVTAAITQAVGLSLALGAFLAGLIVSDSEDAHKTLERMLPVRDAFVALFFVTIGILVDPRVFISHASLWGLIVLLTIVGKFVIWALIVWLFRYPLRTALLVGLGLTQIGEFSYVLVGAARDGKLVGDDLYQATLAASVVTILLNGLLLRFIPKDPASARA